MSSIYLVDTNIIGHWARQTPQGRAIDANAQRLPQDTKLGVSVITLGEIEYGRRLNQGNESLKDVLKYQQFLMDRMPYVFKIDEETVGFYAQLREAIFVSFSPETSRNKKLRIAQLTDPKSDHELQIDENDLWIAAQAAQLGAVLVTKDKMYRIRRVLEEWVNVIDWSKS